MANMTRKLGTILGALALMTGAVPGTIGTAAAVETGQLLDKGPRWPNKPLHFVTIVLTVAALVGVILLVSRNTSDTPTSP